ncbi:hypothetical protein M514_08904 [Trichuris suis]|uniref:Reverse transcriptase domain-containing protein n=1 Tax=Trichuris suis TaxID=68888 RepID=A0A085NBX7_9BILA|nr:hypothetical protein M513_08904 [Trichuris suis]KFD66973.1 hypothetical protein M514_08904 [Trichuris suis]
MRNHIYYISNTQCPELYGLPEIHKPEVPLRPVVSSIESVTARLGPYLKTIIRPLTGSKMFAVKNSKEFCAEIKNLRLDSSDILASYDVKDLFTSIPMDVTLDALEKLLDVDSTLAQRTSLKTLHVNKLVSFCMKEANCFRFQEHFYTQKGGAPIGSPLSAILAEVFMEFL